MSRSVVRQALSELSDRGLIIRQRGRGSVLAPPAEHHRRVNQAGGLRQQLASAGQELRTDIISLTQAVALLEAVEQLGTNSTWFLERRRSVDGAPDVFMRTWIPSSLFPSLSPEALGGGSLLDYMRSTGVQPEGGPRYVEAVAADAAVAEHLDCPVGTPLLLLHGVTRDTYGRGLEWFSAWHRPHTVFDIDARVDVGLSEGDESAPSNPDLQRARELLRGVEALLAGSRCSQPDLGWTSVIQRRRRS